MSVKAERCIMEYSEGLRGAAMNADSREWMSDWTVGVRLWVERGGEAILGPGRLELLEAIERCGSISAAARAVGMSYRRAWLLVDSSNRAAGEPLVCARTGGREGGGTELTSHGRSAVAAYRELQARLQRSAASPLTRPGSSFESSGVRVAAAASLEDVLGRLLAEFALRTPSIPVRTLCGASDELAAQVLNGVHVDLFLSAEERQLDRLEGAGFLASGSRVFLAANRLAAVTRDPRVADLRGPRALVNSRVRRIALATPTCPLGRYSISFLEELGLWAEVRRKAFFLDNPRVVLAAVASGRTEAGLVYRSDAVNARDCRVLFTTRPGRPAIRYSLALTTPGERSSDARELFTFLASPAATPYLRRAGFHPAGTGRTARQ
jgi:molybdenum ABC transporter molybdate-binding protein